LRGEYQTRAPRSGRSLLDRRGHRPRSVRSTPSRSDHRRLTGHATPTAPGARATLPSLPLPPMVLSRGLGASTVARYRPGVRALFLGPSGTGKTLAAGWLATRLGLPLFRVDLASITSKYIGETEKKSGADAGARRKTPKSSCSLTRPIPFSPSAPTSARPTTASPTLKTNYLLQRIETFDGITILTSNSRAPLRHCVRPSPGPE